MKDWVTKLFFGKTQACLFCSLIIGEASCDTPIAWVEY